MKRKLLYVLPLLALCGCSSEEPGDVALSGEMDGGNGAKTSFVRLADSTTGEAGTLTFEAEGGESRATLEWIVADGFNLDTTQTVVALDSGKGTLPIRWDKKQPGGMYAPTALSFKAGVVVTAGTASQYFPLVWADEVDSLKLAAQCIRSRADEGMPRAGAVIMPDTVEMSEASGATMVVRYTAGTSGITMGYGINSGMHIATAALPGFIDGSGGSTFYPLHFDWTADGAPATAFTAEVRATDLDDGITRYGYVVWKANRGPSLILNPTEVSLRVSGGNNIGSCLVTTDQYYWTAVTTQDWLRMAPTAGGITGGTIRFSVDANPYSFDRTAFVIVTGYDAALGRTVSRTLPVTQLAYGSVDVSGVVEDEWEEVTIDGGTIFL